MTEQDLKQKVRDELIKKGLDAIGTVRDKIVAPTKDNKNESRQTRN